jgi:hypothetical protein
MKTISKVYTAFLLLGFLYAVAPTAPGQDAASQIKSQINHLRQALESESVSGPGWKEAKPEIAESLQRADDALRAGRLYLSLEKLEDAWSLLRATENATQKTEEELLREGLPGVDSELQKVRLEITAFEKQTAQKKWDAFRVALRALAENAQGRAMPLLEGGRGFAILADYASALYYAGQAKAGAEFSDFCHSINLRLDTTTPFPLRSISPELLQLQNRVTAAYQPPRSVEHHADFIRLNATLKLANELDAATLYAGALYQFLDATQQFARLDAVAPSAAKQSELRKSLQKMRSQMGVSQHDESIGQLFVEQAEAGLTDSPSADNWMAAETIVEQVVPAYFAASKASPILDHSAPAEVIVTLVRWPYT